jgi:amino-acid N-acetyltransferase
MNVRKATMRDIPAVLDLVNGYAGQGVMLPRTEFEMAENIRDFLVAEEDSLIEACGALHFYTPVSGEIRSVAVSPSSQGRGLGSLLAGALEREARECGLEMLFAFTYVPGFFRKLGYREVDRSELPLKAWKDCMRCPKFQCCDEVAMVKYLDRPDVVGEALRGEMAAFQRDPEAVLIQLPVLKG